MASRFVPLSTPSLPRQTDPLLDELGRVHEEFLRNRKWIESCCDKTLAWHRDALKAYRKASCSGLPDQANLERFKIQSCERGVKPGSVNTWLQALRAFRAWLVETQQIAAGPKVKNVASDEPVVYVFTDEQISTLLHAKTTHRMQLLITLLFETGLRINEALTLKWSEIDYDACELKVWRKGRKGKGRRQQVLGYSHQVRAALYRYQKRYSRVPLVGYVDWVFASRRGSHWSYRNALDILHSLFKRCGIEPGGFHRTRHTFATNFIKQGGAGDGDTKGKLQAALGHSTPKMTERYIHRSSEDIKLAIQRTSLVTRLGR